MRSTACPLRALHSRHRVLRQQESVLNGSLFQPELNTSLIESLNNTISERWRDPSLSLPDDILSIEGTVVAYGWLATSEFTVSVTLLEAFRWLIDDFDDGQQHNTCGDVNQKGKLHSDKWM